MSATDVHFRTCPLCEATCGLEITVIDGKVARIRGDRDDVFSHGFICPKGSTLKQFHEDPDRLREPQQRQGDSHCDVSWDAAFAEIERRLLPIIAEHGPQSVGFLASARLTNEENYLIQKLARTGVGTNSVHSCEST